MKVFIALIVIAGYAAVCAPGQTQVLNFSTGQAARLVIGQPNFTIENYGASNTLLGSPSGLAYANGTLWVNDSNRLAATPSNNRVLRFSDLATYPTPTEDPTILGNTCGVCRGVASLVLGQPGFISTDPALTPAGMRNPTGVATDGNILAVADTDNNRVLIWLSTPKSNGQPADVVIGQPDFTHNATSIPPTATSLRGPVGLWIAGGKLFVADTQDNRILIYNRIPRANNVAADVVVGQPNFTSFVQPDLTQANSTPAANNMQAPISVTTDATHMYVADLGQSRVLIFNTIPTTNGAAADVVVGQPDLVSSIDNNSYTITNSTLDANNNPEGISPVLCQSNAAFALNKGQTGSTAVDAAGTTIYPARCAATLSFPRYVLSDGTRLFIADGGNDRVLVYNTIPATNGVRADAILGEPDEFTDNTGQNPSGSDAFQTPAALAWDGSNLYVSDTYNRRVVVYTAEPLNIPLGATLNAASLEIFALGSVTVGGVISAKDTVTITVDGTGYTYTVLAADTLATVTQALVDLINKSKDPNVTAAADLSTFTIVVTARTPGQPGANVTLAATTSVSAQITVTTSGANLSIYLESPASIAPGTLIEITGQNLCDKTGSADMSQAYLPFTLLGCEIFIDGQRAPLLYVSPTQINAQMHWEYLDRTGVSLYSRVTHADGSIAVSAPIGVTIVPGNPGIFAQSGSDPRPGYVFHASSSANDVLVIDGTATAGDVVKITIGTAPGVTTVNTYSYTVKATDTMPLIVAALANVINAAPDPNVIASAANEFETMILTARVPGPLGENIAIGESVASTATGGATESVTVFNPATCCDNTQGAPVTTDNPALPGETLYVLSTGLGPTTPSDQDTGKIYTGGESNPPLTPGDSIQVAGTAANIISAFLVPGTVGIYAVEFQLSTTQPANSATQMTIAQQIFISNVVTFAVGTPPATPTAAARRPATRRPSLAAAGSHRQ